MTDDGISYWLSDEFRRTGEPRRHRQPIERDAQNDGMSSMFVGQWEYAWEIANTLYESAVIALLKERGKSGWELVSVVKHDSQNTHYYFKRRKYGYVDTGER